MAPDAAEAAACAEADDDDSGFWDLVSILYPEAVEAAGVTTMRELVPRWEPLEKMLMVGVSTQAEALGTCRHALAALLCMQTG